MTQAATVHESLRRELEEADQRFMDAFNAGDIAGAARGVYTEDATVLPPGGDIVNERENIVHFWQSAAEQLQLTRVHLSTVELNRMGDEVCQIGRANLTMGEGDLVESKYVVIWKQEAGLWKWHIDIFNMNQ